MHFFGVDRETANMIYFYYFRSYREVFFAAAITFVFAFLLLRLFRWMTKYFKEIDQGIDALQVDDSKAIRLSPEMLPFESKQSWASLRDIMSRTSDFNQHIIKWNLERGEPRMLVPAITARTL